MLDIFKEIKLVTHRDIHSKTFNHKLKSWMFNYQSLSFILINDNEQNLSTSRDVKACSYFLEI